MPPKENSKNVALWTNSWQKCIGIQTTAKKASNQRKGAAMGSHHGQPVGVAGRALFGSLPMLVVASSLIVKFVTVYLCWVNLGLFS